MSLKTYHGSCHCGAVRFECDIDLAAGTGKCNCSFCTKSRAWNVNIKPDAFQLLAGADALSAYQFGTRSGHHRFCRNCGIRPFGSAYVEMLGGEVVSIALACLDDVEPAELVAAPLSYANGRDNAWWDTPTETRHL